MGLTKEIWLGNDPAHDEARRRIAGASAEYRAPFTFRIATNRKNAIGDRPHWDPFWPGALSEAAKSLGIETFRENGGTFFRSEADKAAVAALAETSWRDRVDQYKARLAQR